MTSLQTQNSSTLFHVSWTTTFNFNRSYLAMVSPYYTCLLLTSLLMDTLTYYAILGSALMSTGRPNRKRTCSTNSSVPRKLNPIAYRGDFYPHHHSISCHSETTSAMAAKLCDFLFLPFCHNLRKF